MSVQEKSKEKGSGGENQEERREEGGSYIETTGY